MLRKWAAGWAGEAGRGAAPGAIRLAASAGAGGEGARGPAPAHAPWERRCRPRNVLGAVSEARSAPCRRPVPALRAAARRPPSVSGWRPLPSAGAEEEEESAAAATRRSLPARGRARPGAPSGAGREPVVPAAVAGGGGGVAAAAVMMNRFRKWLYKPKVSCEEEPPAPGDRRCPAAPRLASPRGHPHPAAGKLRRDAGTPGWARSRWSVRAGASAGSCRCGGRCWAGLDPLVLGRVLLDTVRVGSVAGGKAGGSGTCEAPERANSSYRRARSGSPAAGGEMTKQSVCCGAGWTWREHGPGGGRGLSPAPVALPGGTPTLGRFRGSCGPAGAPFGGHRSAEAALLEPCLGSASRLNSWRRFSVVWLRSEPGERRCRGSCSPINATCVRLRTF